MPNLWNPNVPFSPSRFPFFYGWVIVLGATLGTLFSIPGQTMGFSVFTDVMMRELNLNRILLSTAYCIGTVASGLTLPWLGKIFDAWGARKMIVASAFATGLILFYLSQSAQLAHFLSSPLESEVHPAISFIVIGLGFFMIRASAQGVLTMTCRNAVGKWFDRKRGNAISASQLLVTLGFSAAPVFLLSMINRFGYDGAWQVLGLLTLFVMVPIGWLIFRDNPEECGLSMDGAIGEQAPSSNLDMVIKRDFTRAEALRTISFWSFNLSLAWVGLFVTAFTFHIESIGADFGFDRQSIVEKFIPMAVFSISTNLVFGMLSSRIRIKWLLLAMNLASVCGALGLLYLTTPVGLWAYIIGNGMAGGGFVSIGGIIWPRFFGRRWLGAVSGASMSTIVMASGLGPLGFAISKHLSDSYEPALIASFIIPLTLAISSYWAENPQRKI